MDRCKIVCETCQGNRILSLPSGDYVECPMCEGLGGHEVVASRVQARVQESYTPRLSGGLQKSTKLLLPHSGWTEN